MSIIRSTLAATEIQKKIRDHYNRCFDDAICMFEYRGLNDIYKCTCTDQAFFFKIYARKDIDRVAIEAEVEVVNHLKQSGLAVAYPIAMKDGQYLMPIELPEGTRFGVL